MRPLFWGRKRGEVRVGIEGIGVVGGFGCGLSDMAAALAEGRGRAEFFSMATLQGEIRVPMLPADTSALAGMVDPRALRRTDHHTRMALLGCRMALSDAGITDPLPESLGIIVATGYGSTCNTFDFQELCTEGDIRSFSPIRFSNSVHNAAGAHIAAFLKVRGPNLSVNQFDLSIPLAFLTADHWLTEGRVERVLVGGVDDFARITAFHRQCRFPEDRDSNSGPVPAAVGEGSVFFLLSGKTDRPSRYGVVQEVSTGSGHGRLPTVSSEDVCFIGADGLSSGEAGYGRWVPGPAAVYGHLYGNLPVGMGFDIAVAALSLQEGRIYPSTAGGVPLAEGPELILEPRVLETDRIQCLKLGGAGGYGRVVLAKG